MLNILAIDTASKYLSLALYSSKGYSGIYEEVGNQHSELILPKIQELLKDQSVAITEIDTIVYNQGPGGFTGLRVGLATAIGIALGNGAKLVPIPSFMLFAWHKRSGLNGGDVLIALDARLNQLYLAGINSTSLEYFEAPCVIDPENVVIVNDIKLLGSGFSVYHERFSAEVKLAFARGNLQENSDEYPEAKNLIELAKSGKFPQLDAEDADLFYLRDKVALDLTEQRKR